MTTARPVGGYAGLWPPIPRTPLRLGFVLLASLALAACSVGSGDIRVKGGNELACTGVGTAPALELEGRLSEEPDAERVQLTYAAVGDGRESPFPGLDPIAIPASDATPLIVEYTDDRTRTALCQQIAFDTFTENGERTFVVRMLRERDRNVLAEGRFSIMMAP